jgi:hypothetical protein
MNSGCECGMIAMCLRATNQECCIYLKLWFSRSTAMCWHPSSSVTIRARPSGVSTQSRGVLASSLQGSDEVRCTS